MTNHPTESLPQLREWEKCEQAINNIIDLFLATMMTVPYISSNQFLPQIQGTTPGSELAAGCVLWVEGQDYEEFSRLDVIPFEGECLLSIDGNLLILQLNLVRVSVKCFITVVRNVRKRWFGSHLFEKV